MELEQGTMPPALPLKVADCRTLSEWRNLVKGMSQREVAQLARVKQARISAVELGKVIPRRRHWAALISAYGIPGEDAPSQFYRLVMYARMTWLQAEALKQPISKTEPLLALAQTQPRPVLQVTEQAIQARAQA